MQFFHPSRYRMDCFVSRTITLFIVVFIACTVACAQDSPGRFELGGNFTALHFSQRSIIGPGLEGDVNFGRHLALDGSLAWLPQTNFGGYAVVGLVGVKAGARTQHFGFFGKVRPGFISQTNAIRNETLVLGSTGSVADASFRSATLTQRALDLGGVLEYYPARHWAFRWDFGDTLIFQEAGPSATVITPGSPPAPPINVLPEVTVKSFQFSTGVHYRF